jgi:fatty acid desaturase
MKRSKTWLKYPADRRSVLVVLLTLGLQLLALCLNWHRLPLPAMLTATGALGFFCSVCYVINHNHIHVPFFVADGANRVFSVLISVAEGLSSRYLVVPHNLNHHVYGGKPGDWCHESNAGEGPGAWRMLRYIVVTWVVMFREKSAGRAPRLPARFRRQELVEHGAILAFTLTALALNPLAFALAIFPAWLVAAGFITLTNLIQHEECDADDEVAHSRNYVGRLGNWLLFNAGDHAAHHNRPALHWSELPRLHAELAPRIPARLNEPSVLGYLARTAVRLSPATPGTAESCT